MSTTRHPVVPPSSVKKIPKSPAGNSVVEPVEDTRMFSAPPAVEGKAPKLCPSLCPRLIPYRHQISEPEFGIVCRYGNLVDISCTIANKYWGARCWNCCRSSTPPWPVSSPAGGIPVTICTAVIWHNNTECCRNPACKSPLQLTPVK